MMLLETILELNTTTYTDDVLESLGGRVNNLREIGWAESNTSGIGSPAEVTIDDIRQASEVLRPMAQSHPLHVRGAQLRHSYTFGRGINISGLNVKAQNIVSSSQAQRVLFSVDAQERLNMESFVTWNIFLFRNRRTNEFVLVPAEEITEVYIDSFDRSKLQFVRRTWDSGLKSGLQNSELFPTSAVTKVPKKYDNREVNQEWVVYHKASKSFAGQPLGIPDSFGGALWSVAYSKYLSDSATLTHILKQIAWRITKSQTNGQARESALRMTDPRNEGKVGGTASLAGDANLQSVGVPSAQVDFNQGQPMAAMVAASFGVPVIALISSPGATGGSYGAATTLDTPTLKGFEAVQDSWTLFYTEILRDLVPSTQRDKIRVTFPEIEKDPAYRTMASAAVAYESGAIWRDELRQVSLQLLGVPDLHDGALPPEKKDDTNVVPGQGKSGAVKGGLDQGDTNHDGDEDE